MATKLDDALNNIWQMRGVTGIALYSEGQNLFRQLPGDLDSEDAESFGRHLNQMVLTLTSEGRRPRELYFGYSQGGVLVVAHEGAVLAVLVRDDDAISYIGKIASAFLRENFDAIQGINPSLAAASSRMAAAASPGSLDAWHKFLDGLTRILTKVIGTTQSSYVISRVLAQQGLSQMQEVPQEDYLDIGFRVINEVPNKAKQRSLAEEVKLLVQTLGK